LATPRRGPAPWGGFPPLQPAGVAQSIMWALAAPPHVEIE
jgi:NADP-dependent 3-hydroxy acid dehydrogenase YdfG